MLIYNTKFKLFWLVLSNPAFALPKLAEKTQSLPFSEKTKLGLKESLTLLALAVYFFFYFLLGLLALALLVPILQTLGGWYA